MMELFAKIVWEVPKCATRHYFLALADIYTRFSVTSLNVEFVLFVHQYVKNSERVLHTGEFRF